MEIAGEWEGAVVAPLRGVRRRLNAAPVKALRDQVKAAELGAEQASQASLEALAYGALTPTASGGGEARARRTLAAYVRLAGAAATPGFSIALLEKLIGLTVLRSAECP